jgi:hypothetical protein
VYRQLAPIIRSHDAAAGRSRSSALAVAMANSMPAVILALADRVDFRTAAAISVL